MATKEEFYKGFASLHRSRIDAFFVKAMSKDEFISSLLCVFVEGLSISDEISSSGKACNEINSFLECELYRAELLGVSYTNGDFVYDFEIQIFNDDDVEFELTFFISNNSKDYEIKNEELYFSGEESYFWAMMNQRMKAESTFGTLKRS